MLSFYVCALATAASAYTSLGFSVASLATSKNSMRTTAMYACVRSIALAVVSLLPFFYHTHILLVAIAVAMIIVQLLDAVIGHILHQAVKTYGPAATAFCNLLTLIWFIR